MFWRTSALLVLALAALGTSSRGLQADQPAQAPAPAAVSDQALVQKYCVAATAIARRPAVSRSRRRPVKHAAHAELCEKSQSCAAA